MGHAVYPKEKETKVFLEEYKGSPTFSIWEVDANGDKVDKYPVVSFGKGKAKEIIKHIIDLKAFVYGEDDL